MNIAVIGCGSIGRYLIDAVIAGRAGDVHLVAIAGRPGSEPALAELAATAGCQVVSDPAGLAALGVDLAVEAAGPEAVRTWAVPLLERGIDLMLLSVGVLADAALLEQVRQAAVLAGKRVHVPSGAVGGLDALRGAAVGEIDQVTLTTRKPPRVLGGAPCPSRPGVDLLALTEPAVIFDGPAVEAIRLFPANINVSIALSLVGIGPAVTRVVIVADPTITENIHEVSVSGAFGSFQMRLANRPSPANPRTSRLAALSALALIRRMGEPIQIGT